MKNDKQQPEKGTAIKKRIEVQFIKLEATQKSISNMYEFIYGVAPSIKTSMDRLKWDDYCDDIIRQGYYKLKTMESGEGTQNAKFGCYILKGIDGEFYPCDADIFERTYDVQNDKENPENNGKHYKIISIEQFNALSDHDKQCCTALKEFGHNDIKIWAYQQFQTDKAPLSNETKVVHDCDRWRNDECLCGPECYDITHSETKVVESVQAKSIGQHVKKVADLLDINIYTPMEAFEHGVNTGIDWQSDILQDTTNERDELQKQVITLEHEINHLDNKISQFKNTDAVKVINDRIAKLEKEIKVAVWPILIAELKGELKGLQSILKLIQP